MATQFWKEKTNIVLLKIKADIEEDGLWQRMKKLKKKDRKKKSYQQGKDSKKTKQKQRENEWKKKAEFEGRKRSSIKKWDIE